MRRSHAAPITRLNPCHNPTQLPAAGIIIGMIQKHVESLLLGDFLLGAECSSSSHAPVCVCRSRPPVASRHLFVWSRYERGAASLHVHVIRTDSQRTAHQRAPRRSSGRTKEAGFTAEEPEGTRASVPEHRIP